MVDISATCIVQFPTSLEQELTGGELSSRDAACMVEGVAASRQTLLHGEQDYARLHGGGARSTQRRGFLESTLTLLHERGDSYTAQKQSCTGLPPLYGCLFL